MNGDKFSEEFLKKYYVAVTPGSAFGIHYTQWVRFSYATSTENIRKMLDRLEKFLS